MRKLSFFSISSALIVQNGFSNTPPQEFVPPLQTIDSDSPMWMWSGDKYSYRGKPFNDLDLSNKHYVEIDLTGCTFERVSFANTDLTRANLTNSTFTNCNLLGANLSNANLSGINLSGCSLSQDKLSNIQLGDNVTLDIANRSNINLRDDFINLINSSKLIAANTLLNIILSLKLNIEKDKFSNFPLGDGEKFDATQFDRDILKKYSDYMNPSANKPTAVKTLRNIIGCLKLDLSGGGDLINLNLSGCTFNNCTMTDVKLTNSDLTGSVFNGGSLTRVLIEGTILKDVHFSDTTILSFLHLYEGDPGIVPYFPKTNDDRDLIVVFIGQQKDFIKKSIDSLTTNVTPANVTPTNVILSNNYLKAATSMSALISCMKFDLSSSTSRPGYDFKSRNLSSYNFTNCNLSGADLSHCNMSGCNISGTNFTNANLNAADLSGVVIVDGNNPILSGATVGGNEKVRPEHEKCRTPQLPCETFGAGYLMEVRNRANEWTDAFSVDHKFHIYDEGARKILKHIIIAMGIPEKEISDEMIGNNY